MIGLAFQGVDPRTAGTACSSSIHSTSVKRVVLDPEIGMMVRSPGSREAFGPLIFRGLALTASDHAGRGNTVRSKTGPADLLTVSGRAAQASRSIPAALARQTRPRRCRFADSEIPARLQ
ncbi:hypothetical protein ACQPW1_11680 [Nocardia sp. CA-128927]|uniref:hypothetical protein n=1 Tax=Nocardia sp. CA-128927 TaxID=3239975 RepID=UPI003D96DAFB